MMPASMVLLCCIPGAATADDENSRPGPATGCGDFDYFYTIYNSQPFYPMKFPGLKINMLFNVPVVCFVLCLSCIHIVRAQTTPISIGVKMVNDENTWQNVLKQYKGKTVIICFMNSTARETILKNIEKIRATEKQLKGKKVTFLKCVLQSDGKNSAEYLQKYETAFTEQGMLHDVYYFKRTLSLFAMAEDVTEGHWGIYNAEGLYHHPTTRKFDLNKSWKDQVPATTLLQEMDTVLMGKGHYYERNANYFLRYSYLEKFASNTGDYKAWTLGYTSGPYLTYHAEKQQPSQPMYGRESDSIYQQMKFIKSKIYIEDSFMLKKGGVDPQRFRYSYSEEIFWGSKNYSYVLDKKKNIITINDEKGKLYKRLRIVVITLDVMVVETI